MGHYEELKTQNLGTDSDLYLVLKAKLMHQKSTEEVTIIGIPPITIISNGDNATVGLKGQTLQSSTSSPTSPVMPQGTGERSAQLIPYPFYSSDGEYAGVQFTTDNGRIIANGTLTSGLLYYLWRPANFQAGTYTMSVKGKHSGATIYFRDTTHNVSVAYIYGAQEGDRSTTFTVSEEISAMVYINAGSGMLDFDCTIMLNAGEEALPFEPTNGYKIPLSSANTTTPVYLGEVESTRKIKKLVLTGDEDWNMPYTSIFRLNLNGYLRDATNVVVCTHYKGIAPVSTFDDVGMNETALLLSSSGNNYFYIHDSKTNISTFTTYLQQQYAAGTPVCVWYVLETPETAVVNEPLMKIGDYADEISDITIPTIKGINIVDVDTEVKSSEISITYTKGKEININNISDMEKLTIADLEKMTIAELEG